MASIQARYQITQGQSMSDLLLIVVLLPVRWLGALLYFAGSGLIWITDQAAERVYRWQRS